MIAPGPSAEPALAPPEGPPRRRGGRWVWAVGAAVVAVAVVGAVVLGLVLGGSGTTGDPGGAGKPGGSGGPVGALHPPADVAKPVGGPADARWTIQFDENFTGDKPSVLRSGVWHAGWFGDGRLTGTVNSQETSLFSVDNLTVAGGVATFSVTPNSRRLALRDGATQPNLGAALNTDPSQARSGFTMTYGYVEARMQMPKGNSVEQVWPSFWLNGQKWPDDMEIDVVEGDGTDQGNKFNLHYGSNDHDTTNLNDVPRHRTVRGATTGMHTYGADIRPDGITYYYDGVAVYAYTGHVPDTPRYLMIGISSSATLASGKTLVVDHVRAWTRVGG